MTYDSDSETNPLLKNRGLYVVKTQSPGNTSQQESTISIHNIGYQVKTKTAPCFGKIEEKVILSNITGIFPCGMNAIMGSTGSGKTSLLDVLCGQKDPAGLSGTFLIDGSPPPQNFKCKVGYVEQDDNIMGTLTVRENLQFSAALRLPSSISKEVRSEKVNQVLEELDLTHIADSKVGNDFIRGVSGGERKRITIGIELVTSPSIIFLDEPTTGLDANTAHTVMCILKKLSQKGKTIIFSIHQPRYSIFRLFDNLMLLSEGKIVYHGPSSEALNFFTDMGYQCEEHNNPADFFLDVINGDFNMEDVLQTKDSGMTQQLIKKYQESPHYANILQKTEGILQAYEDNVSNGIVKTLKPIKYATSFPTQLRIVCGRAIKNIIRNPATSILQIVINVIFGLLVGGIYFQLDKSLAGIQNRVGVIFFVIMNQIFANMSAVELFIQERIIFIRENSRGFYRVSSYFFAKIFCDLLPLRFFPVVIFSTITYWMIGFQTNVKNFLIFSLTCFMTTTTASGLSFAISASVRVFAIANSLVALTYVLMMVFGGLLLNLKSISPNFRWIQYLSIFRYGIASLSLNEFKGMIFCDYINGTAHCEIGNITGNSYLSQQDIAFDSEWDLWQNIVGLGCMTVIFMALAYIKLVTMNKMK